MAKSNIVKPVAAVVGVAFVSSLAVSSTAVAADNPFAVADLDSGYQLAGDKDKEGKCGEGKCGANKGKMADKGAEGSCGEKGKMADKGAEGSCGGNKDKMADKGKEGSCGGNKDKMDDKGKEGSCGGNA